MSGGWWILGLALMAVPTAVAQEPAQELAAPSPKLLDLLPFESQPSRLRAAIAERVVQSRAVQRCVSPARLVPSRVRLSVREDGAVVAVSAETNAIDCVQASFASLVLPATSRRYEVTLTLAPRPPPGLVSFDHPAPGSLQGVSVRFLGR
jgi:hypothetical protein